MEIMNFVAHFKSTLLCHSVCRHELALPKINEFSLAADTLSEDESFHEVQNYINDLGCICKAK